MPEVTLPQGSDMHAVKFKSNDVVAISLRSELGRMPYCKWQMILFMLLMGRSVSSGIDAATCQYLHLCSVKRDDRSASRSQPWSPPLLASKSLHPVGRVGLRVGSARHRLPFLSTSFVHPRSAMAGAWSEQPPGVPPLSCRAIRQTEGSGH
eukprot:TRINITY_DN11640_c0_g1_i2.p1 TRINITY_DN11640_c0_g1~~TRINITY_DN11640_c0_g1_i2.p1  ORF type:complete len:151 (+),score=1.75 TRINITY_DN11640_c0_g1_i2:94-546(+)